MSHIILPVLAMGFPSPRPHSVGGQEKGRDLCSMDGVSHWPNNETSSVGFKTGILPSVKSRGGGFPFILFKKNNKRSLWDELKMLPGLYQEQGSQPRCAILLPF